MADSQPMGMGIALTVALLLWAGMLFFRKTAHLRKEEKALGNIAGGFAVLAMCMCLSIFPWDKIHSLNDITATLVSSIQFPNRFLTIATLCAVLVAGVVAKEIKGQYETHGLQFYFAGMMVLTLCSSIYLMDDMLQTADDYRIYGEEGMGSGYIAGAEYLPYGADATLFWTHDPYAGEMVAITDYHKDGIKIEMHCQNRGDKTEIVELPLLYYYGYRAYDKITGQELTITTSDNYAVCVEVPAGYEGTVQVTFVSPWYWRVAEVVSCLSLLGLVAGVAMEKNGREKFMRMIEKIKSKGNSTFWCLVGIFLTGALPLFTNYCLNSAEVPYQLVRIENMKDYLSAGIFQMAMPVNWQYEHGTAGLDGNLFWLLPVLLRMTGAALESVYRMFLICIYAVTVCFSYKTLEEGFQNKKQR